ncbi:MAG: YciI family protein [Polyangiaceae bacterium]
MSEFLYIYRNEQRPPSSPQEMEASMKLWVGWMKKLEEKGNLVNFGHPLVSEGRVVKNKKGAFSDGPYAETKDVVSGFSIVKAETLSEAVELSLGCPIFDGGGIVEVRPIAKM